MISSLLNSVEIQFVAPPLIFLAHHVALHWVSRVKTPDAFRRAVNAGIHLAVMAGSVQWAAALYYGKLAAQVDNVAAHRESISLAWEAAMILMPLTLIAGIAVAGVDGWLHLRHESALQTSSRRKALTWGAAALIVPNVCGFLLFGLVAANIIGVGIMPDVH
jgi:hypothetical protein